MRTLTAAALLASLALPAAGQQTSSDNSFTWTGKIPAGRTIRVRSLNGGITVGAASGDNVEVAATKHWRRGDPAFVRFETKKFGPGNDNVVICAVWGENTVCDENRYDTRNDNRRQYRGNNNNNDVSVEFRILVPKGVKVGVNTINGAITIEGVTGDVDASTINGEIDIEASGGSVNASNVNGGVRARLNRVPADANMEMTTVNGSVALEFGSDFGADVDVQTVSGSLNTNFDMTLSGRVNLRHIRTHIGRPGGPRIRLETVNGNVELKKK